MAVNPISNKKSVLALVKETTEGTPKLPTAATDFTALQDGYSLSPSFETLANAELRASIGKAKDEIGAENPTLSLSHYIKGSGVAGQKPDYGLLIESAMGAVKVDAAERDLVAGSTVSALNVDVGEGVNYERGQAALVQIAGAIALRNILSVAGDVLTLAQNLATAPAALTLIGRAILYKVIDEGHPSITAVNYRGNGGAIEMISGGRVTEMALEAQANQYINGSFTVGGVAYYFNPITLTATSNKLDIEHDAGNSSITLEAKTYKDPHDLCDAINSALAALNLVESITVEYVDSTGKFIFTSTGALFSLEFATGANTAETIAPKLGYTVADKTLALTYTSENAQVWAAEFVPNFDDTNANVAKGNEVMMGDAADTGCFGAQSVNISLSNTKTDIPDLCETSGKSGSLFTGREVSIEVTALLSKHDADRFKRFRKGEKTMFTYNFGVKEGGQWKKNNCVNVFIPSATVTSFEIQDQDGLCVLNTTLMAYVEDGLGEMYMNFI